MKSVLNFFRRKEKVEKDFRVVVPLAIEDVGLENSIARLHNFHIDSKKADRSRFFRRDPVVIINKENGAKIVRYAMGNNGKISIRADAVALDYDAVDALGIRFKRDVDLKIRKAKRYEIYAHLWCHPDVNVKLSFELAIFGAVLGIVGFMTGVLPYVLG